MLDIEVESESEDEDAIIEKRRLMRKAIVLKYHGIQQNVCT